MKPIACRHVARTVPVCVLRPESRGTVHIRSADPRTPPAIQPRYLSAAADRDTSVAAGALRGAMTTAFVVGLVVVWVRYREPAKAWWRRMIEESQSARSPTRQAGRT